MMKLSLMKEVVVNSVNSDWDCELAGILLQDWDHDPGWIKFWRASANFVCFFKNKDRDYIIRFNRDTERSPEDINEEIKLILYLDSKGIKTAKPVLSCRGRYVETRETPYGRFISAVFEKIPGEHPEITEMKESDFRKWGQSMGRIHNAVKTMPGTLPIKRKTHREIFQDLIELNPPRDLPEKQETEWIIAQLDSLDRREENFGLIHYDFETDNIIDCEGDFYAIDFDDAIYSWYAADIAYALRDLFNDGPRFNLSDQRFRYFMEGYQDLTTIDAGQIENIPFFYRFHNYISYKKLQRAMDLEKKKENPEWMNDLIDKLQDFRSGYSRNFYN